MTAATLQLIILPAGVIAILFAVYLARDVLGHRPVGGAFVADYVLLLLAVLTSTYFIVEALAWASPWFVTTTVIGKPALGRTVVGRPARSRMSPPPGPAPA